MAELSNPSLQITLISSSSEADVLATVDVGLTPFEQGLIALLGLPVELRCRLRGADPLFDDDQFTFDPQPVTGSNTFTFARRLPQSTLDEDSAPTDGDELYVRFRLVSLEPTFPLDIERDSGEVSVSL
jgi:hypothetical protein